MKEEIVMKKILCVAIVGCMVMGLSACGNSTELKEVVEQVMTESVNTETESTTKEDMKTKEEQTSEVTTETTSETSSETSEEQDLSNVTPEFKEMMDASEAFFDEYIAFMEKYSKADATDMVAMMTDYTDYLKAYTETMDKMNSIDEKELSKADKLYYVEVTGRINTKLMKVAVSQ